MGLSTKSLITRRNLLQLSAFTGLATALGPVFRSGRAYADTACTAPDACYGVRPASPEAALQALVTGNQKWSTFAQTHPNEDAGRRLCVLKGQSPFAAVISCSDSRVPPELVFDQGIGDLFVARVAGNGATGTLAESLYYGTSHLCAGLIFVLGHSQCGAAQAAVESYPTGTNSSS